MKNCIYCGKPISDGSAYCDGCGAAQNVPQPQPQPQTYAGETAEQSALANMARFLKYEHIAWKAAGIIFLVCSIIFVLCGVLYFVLGGVAGLSGSYIFGDLVGNLSYYDYYDYSPYIISAPFVFGGVVYILYGLLVFLPMSILNFTLVKKVEYYQGTMYKDVSIARTRCTSVGMIVLAAIFNKIAMIFIIINFVKTKNNAATFDKIEAAQKGGRI
ncbi:MAG: hypothetical protein J5585_10570 [Clostridia bacterium]|nr:hypothetical protein [Clostridia bacterium]